MADERVTVGRRPKWHGWMRSSNAAGTRKPRRVMSGMKEWRLHHPKATFREIEAAVDEKLSGMASRAADLQHKQMGEHPRCPDCGKCWRDRASKTAAPS